MRSLRVQLLVSHLALVALMVLVMAGAIGNFMHLGRSIDRILEQNYKSVIAAQNMKEALERLDSADTFLLAGQAARARKQFEEHRPRFEEAFHVEATNITEAGEREITEDIGRRYAAYRKGTMALLYANPPLPARAAQALYFNRLQPQFVALKDRAQGILDLNQAAILRADAHAKSEARRASRNSILITGGALLLALFFAFRMIRSSLTPLRSLAHQAEEIGAGHLSHRIELHRDDEIGALADSFNGMAARLYEARRQEERRLHRAERMSDEALESLYDPVIVTDSAGMVVHLNHAAEGLFGPAGAAAGRSAASVLHDGVVTRGLERAIRQERVSADEGEASLVQLGDADAKRAYRLRATPMKDDDGSLLGAVAVLEDVTHLRHLDRLKTEFISVASHELRTPVTSMLLNVQLLERGAAGPLLPEQREIVSALLDDLQRLQRMMRDLLEVTRLEAGVTPPRFEIVPPRELTEAASEAVATQAEDKGICLLMEAPEGLPEVRADRSQITRALVNLLSNAIRHTPEGGRVRVRALTEDGWVRFRVEDTGSGIPKEYLPRIFDRFVQVPGATRGGAGLGLSIVQSIVHAHGGTVAAESEPGSGSTFTISLRALDGPVGPSGEV